MRMRTIGMIPINTLSFTMTLPSVGGGGNTRFLASMLRISDLLRINMRRAASTRSLLAEG